MVMRPRHKPQTHRRPSHGPRRWHRCLTFNVLTATGASCPQPPFNDHCQRLIDTARSRVLPKGTLSRDWNATCKSQIPHCSAFLPLTARLAVKRQANVAHLASRATVPSLTVRSRGNHHRHPSGKKRVLLDTRLLLDTNQSARVDLSGSGRVGAILE
jgi:hypothetical protein